VGQPASCGGYSPLRHFAVLGWASPLYHFAICGRASPLRPTHRSGGDALLGPRGDGTYVTGVGGGCVEGASWGDGVVGGETCLGRETNLTYEISISAEHVCRKDDNKGHRQSSSQQKAKPGQALTPSLRLPPPLPHSSSPTPKAKFHILTASTSAGWIACLPSTAARPPATALPLAPSWSRR